MTFSKYLFEWADTILSNNLTRYASETNGPNI